MRFLILAVVTVNHSVEQPSFLPNDLRENKKRPVLVSYICVLKQDGAELCDFSDSI